MLLLRFCLFVTKGTTTTTTTTTTSFVDLFDQDENLAFVLEI